MKRRPISGKGRIVYERIDRDWYKVRKYAIKRLREGWKPARLAAHLGVSRSFISKWWKVWLKNKTWESLHDRSTRPKTIQTKKWKYSQFVIDTRKAHPEMGSEKIEVYLGISLSHQSIYEIQVASGQIVPGPKVRRHWRSFARHHSNSLWQMDFKTLQGGGPYLFSIIVHRPHWGIGLRTPISLYYADFILAEDFAPGASVHEVL